MVDRRGRRAQNLIAALGFLPPADEPSFTSCTGSSTLEVKGTRRLIVPPPRFSRTDLLRLGRPFV